MFAIKNDEDIERIPPKFSDTFDDFVMKSKKKNKDERSTMEDLLKHEFIYEAENYRNQWVREF